MVIRKANSGDLEKLTELFFSLVRYESRYDRKRKIDMGKEVEKFERRFRRNLDKKNYVCFVAVESGRIAGFSDAHAYDIFRMNKKCGYVRNIFIKPKYRRKGIGRIFMGEIEKYAKGGKLPALALDVYPKNKQAINVWKSLGFEPVKIHGKFLRMQKAL